MSKKKTKKKKPKVIYIDDGSTIADMSGVTGGFRRNRDPRHSLSEQRKTFLAAMRMMVRPMLFVMGIITLAYLIAYLLL